MATEAEKIEDGGPAFPRIQQFVDSFGHMKQVHDGMSFRDNIAITVAPAMLAELYSHSRRVRTEIESLFSVAATASYEFADAMLKARKGEA